MSSVKKFGSGLEMLASSQVKDASLAGKIYEHRYVKEPVTLEECQEDGKFQRHVVQSLIRHTLHERLATETYHPERAPIVSNLLASELQDRVAGLGYDRYKLIVHVSLSGKDGQAMRMVSRCLWDNTGADNFASSFYENDSIYCVCQVFAVYCE
eukprot:TRINITY_DN1815_c0_g2_i1.p2 TRINITY_DN1815_c0_g2~~TRINITY_DN1815_c0_g2_i1.p2  ORF type:complete len:154 (+),score=14.20 TRINITY_DN1815_c0_g2_i1:558-1019(+)